MTATKRDIVFEQGKKFDFTVQALNPDKTPMNLTGYSGRMQVRETVDSVSTLVDVSTAGGQVTINGPLGIVNVLIGADVTASYTWKTGVYDLEVFTTAPNVIGLTFGFAAVHKEVTR